MKGWSVVASLVAQPVRRRPAAFPDVVDIQDGSHGTPFVPWVREDVEHQKAHGIDSMPRLPACLSSDVSVCRVKAAPP